MGKLLWERKLHPETYTALLISVPVQRSNPIMMILKDSMLSLNVAQKTICLGYGEWLSGFRDRRTHIVRDLDAGTKHIYLVFEYRRVAYPHCKAVKCEPLSWLAKSTRFIQWFEDRICQLCREMTITCVAEFNNLNWYQVWRVEKCYMLSAWV